MTPSGKNTILDQKACSGTVSTDSVIVQFSVVPFVYVKSSGNLNSNLKCIYTVIYANSTIN